MKLDLVSKRRHTAMLSQIRDGNGHQILGEARSTKWDGGGYSPLRESERHELYCQLGQEKTTKKSYPTSNEAARRQLGRPPKQLTGHRGSYTTNQHAEMELVRPESPYFLGGLIFSLVSADPLDSFGVVGLCRRGYRLLWTASAYESVQESESSQRTVMVDGCHTTPVVGSDREISPAPLIGLRRHLKNGPPTYAAIELVWANSRSGPNEAAFTRLVLSTFSNSTKRLSETINPRILSIHISGGRPGTRVALCNAV
ncbi:hypothetical protein AAG570_001361 [Ranatra chinensis]|uniref:Uncharacterized protein n=1 Tax=Ranatra chinensis TaxID=642074 RepID=A0ABD0YU73_9HEMI